MADFYSDLVAETVIPLLEEFGTSFTVRTPQTYDPATADVSGDQTTRTVTGIVDKNFNIRQIFAESSGSWLSTKMLILSPLANILPNEEIQVDGLWTSCENIETLKPADTVLLYMLDITR